MNLTEFERATLSIFALGGDCWMADDSTVGKLQSLGLIQPTPLGYVDVRFYGTTASLDSYRITAAGRKALEEAE